MSGGGLRVGSLFITGANRGIGLEVVKQLTQLPQPPKHIFATCRNPDAAEVRGNYSSSVTYPAMGMSPLLPECYGTIDNPGNVTKSPELV